MFAARSVSALLFTAARVQWADGHAGLLRNAPAPVKAVPIFKRYGAVVALKVPRTALDELHSGGLFSEDHETAQQKRHLRLVLGREVLLDATPGT